MIHPIPSFEAFNTRAQEPMMFDPDKSQCFGCRHTPGDNIPDPEEWDGHRTMKWVEITITCDALNTGISFDSDYGYPHLYACSECGSTRVKL